MTREQDTKRLSRHFAVIIICHVVETRGRIRKNTNPKSRSFRLEFQATDRAFPLDDSYNQISAATTTSHRHRFPDWRRVRDTSQRLRLREPRLETFRVHFANFPCRSLSACFPQHHQSSSRRVDITNAVAKRECATPPQGILRNNVCTRTAPTRLGTNTNVSHVSKTVSINHARSRETYRGTLFPGRAWSAVWSPHCRSIESRFEIGYTYQTKEDTIL